MSVPGEVTAVGWIRYGSATIEDATGDVVRVASLVDFDDDGGHVEIDDQLIEFTASWPDESDEDGEAGFVQLAQAVSIEEGEPVWVVEADGTPLRDYVAYVVCDEGDELEIAIPYAERAMWPEGIYEVPVYVDLSDDLERIDEVPGREPSINGELIDPSTLPDPTTPTEPPATSPDLTVTGTSAGLVVEAENVELSTVIEYHIVAEVETDDDDNPLPFEPDASTVAVGPTRSTVVVISELPDGTPLQPDTTYYLRSVASNVVGQAPPGPMSAGALDMETIGEVVVAQLVAGFILAGEIEVGQISINPDTGITIPQPDGGEIHFPANGIDPATVTAHLIARSLTVEGNANWYGLTQLFGTLRAAAGIVNPSTAPSVSMMWPHLQTDAIDQQDNLLYRGLVDRIGDEGGQWATVFAGLVSAITFIDKATGEVTSGPSIPYTFQAFGGITAIGSRYYVLGRDWTGSRNGDWWTRIYDGTTLAQVDEVRLGTPDATPTIGTSDAGTLLMAWSAVNGRLRVREVNPSTLTVIQHHEVLARNSTKYHLGGIYMGRADYGGMHGDVVITFTRGGPIFFSLAGTGGGSTPMTRLHYREWQRAGGTQVVGAYWNGERFQHLDSAGRVWQYSREKYGAANAWYAFTWYDGNPSGTGTHETAISPPTARLSVPIRQWARVRTPPAPDAGNTDPQATDKADRARVYMRVSNTGEPFRLIETLAVGQTQTAPVDAAPPTTATLPPTTNQFTSAGFAPGTIEATRQDDEGVPIWRLSGSGGGRMGPIEWLPTATSASIDGDLDVDGNLEVSSGEVTTPSTMRVRAGGPIYFHPGGLSTSPANVGTGGRLNANSGLYIGGEVESSGSGAVFKTNIDVLPGVIATGNGDAITYNSNNGRFRRNTSSRRFKTAIEDYAPDTDAVLALEPRIYERIDADEGEDPREVGFIAEEALDLGLDEFVTFDAEGQPVGFLYHNYVVALQHVARDQRDQIHQLEIRLAALEARLQP